MGLKNHKHCRQAKDALCAPAQNRRNYKTSRNGSAILRVQARQARLEPRATKDKSQARLEPRAPSTGAAGATRTNRRRGWSHAHQAQIAGAAGATRTPIAGAAGATRTSTNRRRGWSHAHPSACAAGFGRWSFADWRKSQIAGAAGATRTNRKSQARLEPRAPSAHRRRGWSPRTKRRRGWSHADRGRYKTFKPKKRQNPAEAGFCLKNWLATTYSPTTSRLQYHRR